MSEDELRRIIAQCCEEARAADKVALQALRAVEREAKRRADQVRELRARITTLEASMRGTRAR